MAQKGRPGIRAAASGVLGAAFKLAPKHALALLLVAVFIIATLSALSASVSPMVTVVILVVLTTSFAVYVSTRRYGEASLAFVAGLLTAFAVPWTVGRFLAFLTAWLGFTLLAFLVSSFRLASELQTIYMHAATMQVNDESGANSLAKRLQSIGDSGTHRGMLSPTDRAQVVRLLVFRQVAIELVPGALSAIEDVQVTTRVDLIKVTNFVADLLKLGAMETESGRAVDMSTIIATMRQSSVPPEDFFDAFERSRSLVLSGKMGVSHYFEELRKALERGVSADEMHAELQGIEIRAELQRMGHTSVTVPTTKKRLDDHGSPSGRQLSH